MSVAGRAGPRPVAAVRPAFVRRARRARVNTTAVLHASAAVLIGAGILLSGRPLTIGLVAVGVVLFVAGIVVARRDDEAPAEA